MRRDAGAETRSPDLQRQSKDFGGLPIEPISVRIAVAVKLTGIPRSTLYELIGAGQIETVKIGQSTFIPYRCLKRLIER